MAAKPTGKKPVSAGRKTKAEREREARRQERRDQLLHPATIIATVALIVALLLGGWLLCQESEEDQALLSDCLSGAGRILGAEVDYEDLSAEARRKLQGEAGAPGASGAQGPAGSSGAAGATGSSGSRGPRGRTGAQGDQGATGAQGEQGIQGEPGIGTKGDKGDTGPQGEQGVQGETGPQGEQGIQGEAGLGCLNGSGAPSPDLGREGDFYIDTNAWNIYGPKTAGAWGLPTSLIGPTGPPGGGPVPYHGAVFSDQTQYVNAGGAETLVEFQQEDASVSNGVTWGGAGAPTELRVANAGIYFVQFSAQIAMDANNAHDLFMWPKVNGASLPWSNSSATLNTNKERVILTVNYLLSLEDDSVIQLAMGSTESTMHLLAEASPAVGPEIPGVILTANRVGF